MKRVTNKIILLVLLTVAIICSFNFVLAVPESKEIISNDTKSQLVNITNKEKKSIEDYYDLYGKTYGTVAYVLNKVRVYSIPICFLGIAISAIYEYILGIRHMETRDKGFNMMITIITIFVICQVLPLVFAIIIKGWRNE